MVEKYRLRVLDKGVEKLVRGVYAQKHFLPEERIRASVREEYCVFAASEVPPGATVTVQPLNEWGRGGREISSRLTCITEIDVSGLL